MAKSKMDQMTRVTEALYLKEFAKVQPILEEEGRIRTALRHLDEQRQQGHDELSADSTMQRMGADILWQTWAARTRTSLNIELAQVLARKETVLDQVRKAFGKREALKKIVHQEKKQRELRRTTKQQQSIVNP